MEDETPSTKAIKAEGLSTSCFYDNLAKPENQELSDRYARACDARDLAPLEEEAKRRAYDGVEKPVFKGGKLVGHVREYSDSLLIFLLKARNPRKYAKPETVVSQTNVTKVEAKPPKRKRSKEEDLDFAKRLKRLGIDLP